MFFNQRPNNTRNPLPAAVYLRIMRRPLFIRLIIYYVANKFMVHYFYLPAPGKAEKRRMQVNDALL